MALKGVLTTEGPFLIHKTPSLSHTKTWFWLGFEIKVKQGRRPVLPKILRTHCHCVKYEKKLLICGSSMNL
ncbi:hypothetical protein CsSME_00044278 [Camellia sinensis var. sinensis]